MGLCLLIALLHKNTHLWYPKISKQAFWASTVVNLWQVVVNHQGPVFPMESKSKSKSLCQTNTQTTRNHKPACCQHFPGDCNSAVGWTQSPAFASITSRGWPVHEANILIDPLSIVCINRATRICEDMLFMYVKLPRPSPRHCQISVSARIWLTHDYGYTPGIYSSYNMFSSDFWRWFCGID